MRPKAIFLSAHLPSPNVPVAGQKLAWTYLKELSKDYEVTLLAFINETETMYYNPDDYDFCTQSYVYTVDTKLRLMRAIFYPLYPLKTSSRIDIRVRKLITSLITNGQISLLHAQYSSMAYYLTDLPEDLSTEIVVHDVVYQSISRFIDRSSMLFRLLYKFEHFRQKRWEIEAIKKCRSVITLNEKDRCLLEDEGVNVNQVQLPSAPNWIKNIQRRSKKDYSILFLGAMNRIENQDAVMWFVKNVFNRVKEQHPKSTFHVVGGAPPKQIRCLESESIKIHGFVEDLSEIFSSVSVAVAPLHLGAGVKIKVIETVSANIPTISTNIGAEGIPPSPNLINADTASEFVDQICRVFDN